MRSTVLLVGIFLVLSGCAGKAGPKETAAPTESQADVLPPGVTNVLEGKVQSIDLEPLDGALVKLDGTNESRVTDTSGTYRFENLPPKDYIVVASRELYKPKTQRAVIEDDRIFQLDFILEPVPTATPYHETQRFAGLISCQAHYQTAEDNPQRPDCGGAADTNNAQSHVFNIGPSAAQIVVELQWTPTSSMATELTISVDSMGDDGVQFAYDHGTSVLKVTISEAIIRKNFFAGGELRTFVESGPSITGDEAAADVGLAFQQEYEIYLTTFYHEIGPASFSALDEG